ncbi:MAG TPA: hypothetical protein VMH01_15865 [Puia sp.]|nr:hypothetical protein [Puia sp.]
MKKIIFPLLWFASATSIGQQNLDGAFKVEKAKYANESMNTDSITVIKIFKDGYWIGAFFSGSPWWFDGCGGGTYRISKGKYIETVHFWSWDSTAAGSVITFNYKLEKDKYTQEGKINSAKYKDYSIEEEYQRISSSEPLKNNSLEGAWVMEAGQWGKEKLGEGEYKNVMVRKIFAYPRFAFAYFDMTKKRFIGAGGGTYQYDGKTLTEKIEYWSWGTPDHPVSEFKIAMLSENKFSQSGWDNGLSETWKKLH